MKDERLVTPTDIALGRFPELTITLTDFTGYPKGEDYDGAIIPSETRVQEDGKGVSSLLFFNLIPLAGENTLYYCTTTRLVSIPKLPKPIAATIQAEGDFSLFAQRFSVWKRLVKALAPLAYAIFAKEYPVNRKVRQY